MLGLADARELASLLSRAWDQVTPRIRADHQTILTRRMPDTGHRLGGFYAVAAVAPSRHLRQLVDPSDLADAARQWVRAGWPGTLDGTVYISVPELVRFETPRNGAEIDLSVEIRPNGLVETRTRLPTDEHPDGAYLDLLDVVRTIAVLARAIEQPPLRHLWQRRRLDWYFNLSSQDSSRQGATHWAGLILPDSTSPGRATNAFPTTPPEGFAADHLRGWRRRRPIVELMTVAARSLLQHTGYHSFGDAPLTAAHRAVASVGHPAPVAGTTT